MDADFIAGLLRRMRHDIANHLQVISGYLLLGEPGQAQEYLRSVVEDLDGERALFTSLPAPAGLYLYDQLLQARDQGFTLRFEDIDLRSWEILKANGEPGTSLQGFRPELDRREDERAVFLSIYEDADGVDLLYSLEGSDVTRLFRVGKR